MGLIDIVKDYIKQNKVLFTSYLTFCCLSYIIKVLFTSKIYSKLFDPKQKFEDVIGKICMLWAGLCVLYVVRLRLETAIVPDFLSFIRKRLFENYIRNNEHRFNDSDVNLDLSKLLEVSRNVRDIFVWICGTFIPVIMLMIVINIYFFSKFPKVGGVMAIGNVITYGLIRKFAPELIHKANIRENNFMEMVNYLNENFENLLNIFLNDKVDDTIAENVEIEDKYTKVYEEQNKELETFSTKLKINNYLFAFFSMFALYKSTTDQAEFINGLLIFTFYLSSLENMTEDISFSLMTLGNIQNIEDSLREKDPNHVRAYPIYDIQNATKQLDKTYKGSISFKNIYFRYNKDTPYILENFNLDIQPGEKIAFVAQSGFGKTTTIKMLLGFYKPEKGDILVDGENIKNISVKSLRNKINYINQKTLLFNATILDNLKYGNNKSTEEILAFLRKYDLLKIFCQDNQNCLTKMVERHGTNISMGMQKIIFLVRGVLKNNVAVYVFDEPLTSVDPSTRSNILRMIKNETGNKTTIIITHDKEVSQIVDRTVDLKALKELQSGK